MQFRKLGNTDIDVSLICLGTMTWGSQNSEAEGHAQIDYALDQGINFLDTAEGYPVTPASAETQGRTEEIIGTWIESRKARDRIVLATKVAGPSRGDARRLLRALRAQRQSPPRARLHQRRDQTEGRRPIAARCVGREGDELQVGSIPVRPGAAKRRDDLGERRGARRGGVWQFESDGGVVGEVLPHAGEIGTDCDAEPAGMAVTVDETKVGVIVSSAAVPMNVAIDGFPH